MTAVYTWDVFSTLDGYGSYGPDGDWGGYWGKQGPEFLENRLAVISKEQRMVLGANTFRQFVELLDPIPEADLDPVNSRMRSMPTTVALLDRLGAWSRSACSRTTRSPEKPGAGCRPGRPGRCGGDREVWCSACWAPRCSSPVRSTAGACR